LKSSMETRELLWQESCGSARKFVHAPECSQVDDQELQLTPPPMIVMRIQAAYWISSFNEGPGHYE